MSDDQRQQDQDQHDWEMNAGADATAAAVNRAAAARSWVVLLISDMSWLVGMAEGSGNTVPPRITDDLGEAISWLAGTP